MHQAFHLERGTCLSTLVNFYQDTHSLDLWALLAQESTLFLVPDYHPQPMDPRIIHLHLLQETYCLPAPEMSLRQPLGVAARTPHRL